MSRKDQARCIPRSFVTRPMIVGVAPTALRDSAFNDRFGRNFYLNSLTNSWFCLPIPLARHSASSDVHNEALNNQKTQ
jgi:hypothetical protein